MGNSLQHIHVKFFSTLNSCYFNPFRLSLRNCISNTIIYIPSTITVTIIHIMLMEVFNTPDIQQTPLKVPALNAENKYEDGCMTSPRTRAKDFQIVSYTYPHSRSDRYGLFKALPKKKPGDARAL